MRRGRPQPPRSVRYIEREREPVVMDLVMAVDTYEREFVDVCFTFCGRVPWREVVGLAARVISATQDTSIVSDN